MTGVTDGEAFDLDAVRAALASSPGESALLPIGLRTVLRGPGVLSRLPDVVTDLGLAGGPFAVLVDATPIRAGGREVKPRVRDLLAPSGPVTLTVLGPPDGHAVVDPETLDRATAALAGATVAVTVGSGTVTDIGKVAAARAGIALIVVQTADSVNGFADDQSVVLVDGVKRTVASRWPDALLIDTDVLADAPARLNLAGLGDMVGVFTAAADWYLAGVLGMDPSYDPTLIELVRPPTHRLLPLGRRIAQGDPAVLADLGEVLAVSGIVMGVAGQTAPSSGLEHTISHLLDMAAHHAGQPARLHGHQVAVGTVAAAHVWRLVREHLRAATGGSTGRAAPADDASADADDSTGATDLAGLSKRVHAAFDGIDPDGTLVTRCLDAYRSKRARRAQRRSRLVEVRDTWQAYEPTLERLLVDPAELTEALTEAGLPTRFADLDPPVDRETALWALGSGHLMRDRFSVADLADALGLWDAGTVASLVDAVERT